MPTPSSRKVRSCATLVALLRRVTARGESWVRARVEGRWHRPSALTATVRAVEVLHRADRATRYRFGSVARAHLLAIGELYERAAFDEAVDATDAIASDLAALARSGSSVALRARAERARSLARLDRGDEAVEALVDVLEDAASGDDHDERWRLSCGLALALMRRDVGDLDASTEELRRLVPRMADEFGEGATWTLATVTELATNVALDGDAATASAMLAAELPAATRAHGPLSREALTLRARIARWSLDEGAPDAPRLAQTTVVDFTRAGLATCAESLELRYVLAGSRFESGDVDYAIAQLASLRDDLDESSWCSSPFADVVRTELTSWRDACHGDGH